ncbi:MAG TPA: DUF3147 family protein [Candidatus Dormibacteraeota bacterium]
MSEPGGTEPQRVPEVHPGEIRKHSFQDYLIRFCFGAGISLGAGLIGLRFGPVVGGIFLGFPAILPASLTLIQKKEGRERAAIDSEGAILGAIALVGFALVAWLLFVRLGIGATLLIALAVWLIIAVALYAAVMATLHREPAPR